MADKFTVLVVDDIESNRITLKALLSEIPDCSVVEADSGESALKKTVEETVHLILLDLQMPVMDGFETANILKMTERTRNIPVIFITAVFKEQEFIRRGFALGAVDYLTKPIDDNLVLSRVKLYQHVYKRECELEKTISLLTANEQAMQEARDSAEKASRAKSVFLANMSHELRTPLNAILGFSRLLEQDESLQPDSKKMLATINRSGQHLLELINDVLEISRIEAGRVVIQNKPFDLLGALHSVTDMMAAKAKAKGLAFSVNIADNIPSHVTGDGHHTKQILINLLNNAVKYTNSGEVSMTLKKDADHLLFSVQDTGPGISSADFKKIFKAFYQTENGIEKGEGTGLGLAICKEYATAMHGALSVENNTTAGCTFTLTLPLADCETPIDSAPLKRVSRLSDSQDNVTVLVVDDNVDSQDLVRYILTNAGFSVVTADNGQIAVHQFQKHHPDFIWMDMSMPVMDGYEASKQIRAMEGGDSVKIVALTASVFSEDKQKIIDAGCDDIVKKPLEEEQLFSVMGELLGLAYEYCDSANQAENSQESALNYSQLPRELREKIIHAAQLLDLEQTRQLIDYTEEIDKDLAENLRTYLDEFKFDKIVSLMAEQTL